jgi:poly(hydroxyalkanoate) depolymerase family esterase
MKFPRLPLLSKLLRKPSRTASAASTASIAATIDTALRSAGLIVDAPASSQPSTATATTTRTATKAASGDASEALALPGAVHAPPANDRSQPSPRLASPTTAKSRVSPIARGRMQAARAAPIAAANDVLDAIVPGFTSSELTTPFGKRSFKLFVPENLPDGPSPLIVMLHGCTQDADDFAIGTRMNLLAQDHGCFVLYPIQRSGDNASRCWNWFRPGDQHRSAGEPALLAALTRHVMQQCPIDADRVYVAGLSAGAAMAGILLREFPELFAAAGMHSGLAAGAARDVGSAFAAMQGRAVATELSQEERSPRPVIIFQGDSDRTVHASNADRIVATHRVGASRTTQGAAGRPYEVETFERSARHAAAERWLIKGAGHAWSGGDPRGSHTDASGPDASREMLRFFLDNPARGELRPSP